MYFRHGAQSATHAAVSSEECTKHAQNGGVCISGMEQRLCTKKGFTNQGQNRGVFVRHEANKDQTMPIVKLKSSSHSYPHQHYNQNKRKRSK